MKQLWNSIKVLGLKEINGKTILQISTETSKEEILKYATAQGINGEIKLDDGRCITAEQRKKIFACIKDFSLYTGYEAEYARQLFTLSFCYEEGIEPFSLSDCSMEIAREFISFLIEFCIEQEIPLAESPIERTDDIGKYLYSCLKRKVCCICGKEGIVYSLGNQDKICLCDIHHDEGKRIGLKALQEKFKIYPLKIK